MKGGGGGEIPPKDQPGHDGERGDEHVDEDALLPGDPLGCARRRAPELSCRCRESGAGGDAASWLAPQQGEPPSACVG